MSSNTSPLLPNTVSLHFIEDVRGLDNTLSMTTGDHSYSKKIIRQCMLSMFAGSYNMHSISFINSLPKFLCPGVDGVMRQTTESEACSNFQVCRAEYFYEGWVKQYDMLCHNRSRRVFFVSLIFVLNAAMFFSLNTLGDKLGRSKVLQLSTFVATFGTFLIFFLDDYGAKIILFGLVTGTYSVFQMMFTLGMKEAMPSTTPYNAYMNAIVNCAYNVAPVLLAFLAMVLDYQTLCFVSVLLMAACALPNLCMFHEPPMYLYRKQRIQECLDNLVKIARVNSVETVDSQSLLRQIVADEQSYLQCSGKQPTELKELPSAAIHSGGEVEVAAESVPSELQQQEGGGSVAQEQSANLTWVTAVLCYWCSCMYLVSYGTLISFEKSGMDNLYVNMIVLGVASFIGYGVCIKFPKDIPRIRTISVIMGCLLCVSFVILLLDAISSHSQFVSVLKSVCIVFLMPILVCMGFSVMYLYLPDVFPVTSRGMGIGIVIFVGKSLGGASSAYIANFMNQHSLNPIAGCTLPSLALLFLLRTVPQN